MNRSLIKYPTRLLLKISPNLFAVSLHLHFFISSFFNSLIHGLSWNMKRNILFHNLESSSVARLGPCLLKSFQPLKKYNLTKRTSFTNIIIIFVDFNSQPLSMLCFNVVVMLFLKIYFDEQVFFSIKQK